MRNRPWRRVRRGGGPSRCRGGRRPLGPIRCVDGGSVEVATWDNRGVDDGTPDRGGGRRILVERDPAGDRRRPPPPIPTAGYRAGSLAPQKFEGRGRVACPTAGRPGRCRSRRGEGRRGPGKGKEVRRCSSTSPGSGACEGIEEGKEVRREVRR